MELIESTSLFLSTVVNVFGIYMYLGKTVVHCTQFNGGGVVGQRGFDANSGLLLNFHYFVFQAPTTRFEMYIFL